MSYKFTIEKELPEEIIPYVKADLTVSALKVYLQFIKDKLQKSDLEESEAERLIEARAKLLDILIKHNVSELFD